MNQDRLDRIIAMLKAHPGSTAKELAPLLSLTRGPVSQSLSEMHDFGMVVREKIAITGREPGGWRVEYRYWFKPKVPIETKASEGVR